MQLTLLTQNNWKLSHVPLIKSNSNPGSGERQQGASGKTLDHSAIRRSPQALWKRCSPKLPRFNGIKVDFT